MDCGRASGEGAASNADSVHQGSWDTTLCREVSRIERRPDVMLSTVRRYAAALGTRCEVVLVFADGRHVVIAEPTPDEPAPR